MYDVSITLEEFGAVEFSSEMQIAIKEKINKMVGCSYFEDLDTNFNLEPSFYDEDIKFGIFNSNHKSMTLFFDFFHEKIYEHRKLLMDKNSRAFLKGLESQDLKYIKMLGFIISLDSGIGFYIPLNEEKAEHIHLMITKWDTIFFEKFIGSLIKRYNSDSFFINDEVLFLKKFIRNVESYSKDCKYIRRHVLDSGLKQLKSIFLRHEDKNIET
ncbi:hypothetical protein GCM10011497_34520 [Elstera cyanobacteriorum]|uniref:hypothetical protein n=1 Tax=Elstera cyanobacteriorum TaxID=2022747 RepID=UPI00114037F6|nr:hypothetical protein [Elstera cyanobacteriorum]GGA00884.1 hypothetical protein GCM10011497_34520 [Elstera cyanobacteriorum]